MKKKFLKFALLLFASLQIPLNTYAQKSKEWYEEYFRNHISELDPIEGIYSIQNKVTISFLGRSESLTTTSTDVIIKKDGLFIVYSIEEDKSTTTINNGGTNLTFKRLGESSIYDFTQEWPSLNNCTASGRVYLNSLYGFTYETTLPQCVVKAVLKNGKYASNYRLNLKCELIKTYPTSSMYNQSIKEEKQPSEWSGSGFAIGNGYIVTNNHVVEGANKINVKGVKGDLNSFFVASVVSTDIKNDIAIIKINDSRFNGFGTLPYSVTTRLADVGEDVFVLGYPLIQALGDEIKLTNGIISSRTGYQGDISTYQISAPVQPGNSGGPMFDSKGNVNGIVNASVPGADNVGYAIKISYLKNLIESAGLNVALPNNNTISNLSLSEKVKRLKNFVFYIECSK